MITIFDEIVLGLRVSESVAVGLHCEFQGFQAMVLGEIGHEGTQSVRLGRRVCEDLMQVGHARSKGRGQTDGT